MSRIRKRIEAEEPNSLAESSVIAAATDNLLGTGAGRGWRPYAATYCRESTIRGGGRQWTLRCSLKFDGRRFLAWVLLWSGDPEAPPSAKRRAPSPQLLQFVAETERRLRGMGLRGRFKPAQGEHWPGSFEKWFIAFGNVDRAVRCLERFERRMGAVVTG